MSGEAIVTKLRNIRPHPNADRLQLATACNYQIITDLSASPDQLYLFFDEECQLSEEFCRVNNLFAHSNLNSDKTKKGYFPDNRRVRITKLRGEKSEGFVIELDSLRKVNLDGNFQEAISKLSEGDQFTDLAGIPITCKYITPVTQTIRGSQKQNPPRKKNPRFPEHRDTEQLRKSLGKIKIGDIIYLSAKDHGTSGRYTYTSEEVSKHLPWYIQVWFWFLRLIGKKFKSPTETQWNHLVGTRRVVKSERGTDWHGPDDYRWDIMKDKWHLFRKGEIVFGELVGWTSNGGLIMPSHSTTKCDKSIQKQYGSQMIYKYGCPEGTTCFLVYRIAMTNEEGILIDLPWPQVVRRASELGFRTVHQFEGPLIVTNIEEDEGPVVYNSLTNVNVALTNLVNTHLDLPDPIDSSHIIEGVVVRIENETGVTWMKEKSYWFRLMENLIKEEPKYVDTEEVEGQ